MKAKLARAINTTKGVAAKINLPSTLHNKTFASGRSHKTHGQNATQTTKISRYLAMRPLPEMRQEQN